MKHTAKVQLHAWLKGLLLAMLLYTGVPTFTATTAELYQTVTCVINDLQRSGPTQGIVYYSWSAVAGATAYKVYYVRLNDGFTSTEITTSSTSYTSPLLSPGTYRFNFAPICGEGTPSYIADELIIN